MFKFFVIMLFLITGLFMKEIHSLIKKMVKKIDSQDEKINSNKDNLKKHINSLDFVAMTLDNKNGKLILKAKEDSKHIHTLNIYEKSKDINLSEIPSDSTFDSEKFYPTFESDKNIGLQCEGETPLKD